MTNTTVVIVDDHRMVRGGLRLLLEREGISVVGEAGDANAALACVEKHSPNILLLDYELPGGDGLQVAREVHASHPSTRVIILSAHHDAELVGRALQAGAMAFLTKEEATDELIRAVGTVIQGNVCLSPVAATSLANCLQSSKPPAAPEDPIKLLEKELTVLKFVVEGLRNKEIADRMGLSIKSVESYRAKLMAKARCSSPAELVRFALQHKLI